MAKPKKEVSEAIQILEIDEYGLLQFCIKLADAAANGWTVSTENDHVPQNYSGNYTIKLVRATKGGV